MASKDFHAEASEFAKAVAKAAEDQFALVHGRDEGDIVSIIKGYWKAVGGGFTSVEVAWSAVFVSSCVKKADPHADFKFSAAHAVFVKDAINRENGAYHGVRLTEHAPRIGDIIQNNRTNPPKDFDFAKKHEDYFSHSAIVVEKGEDTTGKYVVTIGGNEGDSVRKRRVPLNSDGTVQNGAGKFICVLICQK